MRLSLTLGKTKAKVAWRYIKALYRLQFCRKHVKKENVMRVVFLMQYIPAWNKLQGIYQELKMRNNVEIFLVCVPLDISKAEMVEARNDTYEYFEQKGYSAINALIGRNEWYDLRQIRPDFIFCSRPYNQYMPREYSSEELSKYSRICSILYGPTITEDMLSITLNQDFYKDVSYYFATSCKERDYWNKRFLLGCKLGLQRAFCLGNPVFEEIEKKKHDKIDDRITVIWTPRWSSDQKVGGTNFFRYKDVLLDRARNDSELKLIIRPHPMMFDNFVRTGEMSVEMVHSFQEKIEREENVVLDMEQEYSSTFWDTSVMISDISSIMMEYFITGKPLIYCTSNIPFRMTTAANTMLEGCYIVNNQDELNHIIDRIKKGEDPLKQRREDIIKELFGNFQMASSNIVDWLISEWEHGNCH